MVSLFRLYMLYFVFGGFVAYSAYGLQAFMPLHRNKSVRENGSTNWIEYEDELCPYISKCRISSENNDFSIFKVEDDSPCQPCECSSRCWTTNCCKGQNRVVSACRDQSSLFNEPRALKNISSTPYYVIDRCLESYPDVRIIADCLQPKELPDFALVSGDDERIFKNGKCAMCNNVENYVYWDLVAIGSISVLDYDINTLIRTIVTELPVYSKHPPNLSILYKATYKCYPKAVGVCNWTQEWDVYDAELEELCLTSSTTTYAADYYGLPMLYSNLYCFLCNKATESVYSSTDLHFNPMLLLGELEQETDLKIIFNTSKLSSFLNEDNKTYHCKVDEIYDSFMEKCHKLLCPVGSIAINGGCDSSLFYVEGLMTSLVFELSASHFVNIVNGRRLYFKNILDNLVKGYNISSLIDVCGICRTMYYQHDQSLQMFVEMVIQIRDECKESLITETVSNMQNMNDILISFSYLFKKITFNAKLATDFSRTGIPEVFSKGKAAHLCEGNSHYTPQDRDVLSPSIRLTDADIKEVISKVGSFASERLLLSIRNDSKSSSVILEEYMSIIKKRLEDTAQSTAVGVSFEISLLIIGTAVAHYLSIW